MYLTAVTYLTADTCLTADPGVMSSIPVWSPTFVEIDHEIISAAILLLSADSRRVVRYKRKYAHKELVKCLVKLAQEKSVVRLTECPSMAIAVDWDIKNQTSKQVFLQKVKTHYCLHGLLGKQKINIILRI